MLETLQSEPKVIKTFERRANESPVFHERSLNDPLVFAYSNSKKRAELLAVDEHGISGAFDRKDFGELVEFSTDRAILGFIEDTGDATAYARLARDVIKERLTDQSILPAERLGLCTKLIDMNVLEAFDIYHSLPSKLNKTERRNALKLLESAVQRATLQGAQVLAEMQKEYVGLRAGTKEWQLDASNDLAGKMFELLAITNRRRRIYADEIYDERLIVSVPVFLDNAAVLFAPNHNYDALEINASGEVTEVLQCKKSKRDDYHYDDRITVVTGSATYRFFENPSPFIESLQIAVQNPEDPRYQRVMEHAVAKVESLFSHDHGAVGATATRELVHV